MALSNTYFETKGRDISVPIPDTPGYTPPSPPTPPTPGSGSTPVIPRPVFSGDVDVNIYINSTENNALDKSLSSKLATTISVKDELSIFSPSFYLNTSTDISGCNYAKVGNRYYFANITLMSGNLYRVDCRCDVLMTFKDQIRQQTGLIRRNLNQYNRYLQDDRIKVNAYESVKTLEFSSGFSKTMNYYLVTVGGPVVSP